MLIEQFTGPFTLCDSLIPLKVNLQVMFKPLTIRTRSIPFEIIYNE